VLLGPGGPGAPKRVGAPENFTQVIGFPTFRQFGRFGEATIDWKPGFKRRRLSSRVQSGLISQLQSGNANFQSGDFHRWWAVGGNCVSKAK